MLNFAVVFISVKKWGLEISDFEITRGKTKILQSQSDETVPLAIGSVFVKLVLTYHDDLLQVTVLFVCAETLCSCLIDLQRLCQI